MPDSPSITIIQGAMQAGTTSGARLRATHPGNSRTPVSARRFSDGGAEPLARGPGDAPHTAPTQFQNTSTPFVVLKALLQGLAPMSRYQNW